MTVTILLRKGHFWRIWPVVTYSTYRWVHWALFACSSWNSTGTFSSWYPREDVTNIMSQSGVSDVSDENATRILMRMSATSHACRGPWNLKNDATHGQTGSTTPQQTAGRPIGRVGEDISRILARKLLSWKLCFNARSWRVHSPPRTVWQAVQSKSKWLQRWPLAKWLWALVYRENCIVDQKGHSLSRAVAIICIRSVIIVNSMMMGKLNIITLTVPVGNPPIWIWCDTLGRTGFKA